MHALLMLPLVLAAEPVTYVLDQKETEIFAFTSPAGLLKSASHEHVIDAKLPKGEITFDGESAESLQVKVTVNPNLFINDDPATIKRFKVKNDLDNADREKVARSMREKDQLDTAKFTAVTFTSTGAKKLDGGKFELSGSLTIHGVSVPVKLPVTATVKDGVFRGEGELGIKQSAFGFEPFSTGLGAIKNADPVTIKVTLVGKPKS